MGQTWEKRVWITERFDKVCWFDSFDSFDSLVVVVERKRLKVGGLGRLTLRLILILDDIPFRDPFRDRVRDPFRIAEAL